MRRVGEVPSLCRGWGRAVRAVLRDLPRVVNATSPIGRKVRVPRRITSRAPILPPSSSALSSPCPPMPLHPRRGYSPPEVSFFNSASSCFGLGNLPRRDGGKDSTNFVI